jgi:hypothetical protein
VKTVSVSAAAIVSFVALLSGEARGTDLPYVGGEGGNNYRVECPAGAFVVGFRGRSGDWVDRLQVVCSPWNGNTLGNPQVLPTVLGNSGGGYPNDAYCPGAAVVVALTPSFTTKRGEYVGFLDDLAAECFDVGLRNVGQGPAYRPSLRSSGGQRPVGIGASFHAKPDQQRCPDGELASGVHGRAGLFIDSIGLICGPAPWGGGGIAIGRARNPTARAIERAGQVNQVGVATGGSVIGGAATAGGAQRPVVITPATATQAQTHSRATAALPSQPASPAQADPASAQPLQREPASAQPGQPAPAQSGREPPSAPSEATPAQPAGVTPPRNPLMQPSDMPQRQPRRPISREP